MQPQQLLDREVEQAKLADVWARAMGGDPQLVVAWGRRRVGKTFLLADFVRGKRAVFFGATQQAEAVELGRLADAVTRGMGADTLDLAGGGFRTWEAALRYFVAQAREEPLAVVLDEVPYLARSTAGFASVVQAVWDHVPAGTKILLVLTGSAVGTIETMLGAGGALRGRPTLTLRIDPVDLTAARTFLPTLSAPDLVAAYAACGGYPLHLLRWDASAGVGTNLLRLAGTPGDILLEDASSILREELPDVGGYPRILAAIGRGRTRLSEIANEARQRVEHPLDVLVRAGFVRKTTPIGAPRRSRPLYEIADPYLAFWFGVLYSDLPQIEAGQGAAVLHRRQPEWLRHLGWVFEEAARAHAVRLVERGELDPDIVVGRWWSTSGEALEIDVLGLKGSRALLVGEARWQAGPLGARDVRELAAKASRLPNVVDDPIFVLWGRGGAEPSVTASGVRTYSVIDVIE